MPHDKHSVGTIDAAPVVAPRLPRTRVRARVSRTVRQAVLAALTLAVAAPCLAAPDSTNAPLVWRKASNHFDAAFENASLSATLQELANVTGWSVLVEPGIERSVSARFTRLQTPEALRRLLGDLHFAVLPTTNRSHTLFIYRNSIQDATQAVAPNRAAETAQAAGPDAISNELIVTLKKDAARSIESLAAQFGARIIGRADELGAYRLEFETDAAANAARERLEQNEAVSSVDLNHSISAPGQIQPLAASSLPPLALRARAVPADGQVVVGLIDTAVLASGGPLKDFLLKPLQIAPGSESAPGGSTLTHGTSMAETILRGIALTTEARDGSPVRILPVDVYGANSTTTSFEVASGIYAAAAQGARIINLSLGSDYDNGFLHRVIEDARAAGVVMLAAAGNEPTTAPTFPAAYSEVLAVTAGDKSGRIAPYANRGAFVDAVAPGSTVIHFNQQAFLGMGTSYSTALVSGAAGALAPAAANPQALEAELRKRFAPVPPKP